MIYAAETWRGGGGRTLRVMRWIAVAAVLAGATGFVSQAADARGAARDGAAEQMALAGARGVATAASRVVGGVERPLDRQALAALIADAYLTAMRDRGADAGLVNREGIGANLGVGAVTYADAWQVLPRSHDIVLREYTGAQLRAALQSPLATSAGSSNLTYDVAAGTVTNLHVDFRPVADDALVSVAMSRALARTLQASTGPGAATGPTNIDAFVDELRCRSHGAGTKRGMIDE